MHLGRRLIENMPRGYELELPGRRSNRPIPFIGYATDARRAARGDCAVADALNAALVVGRRFVRGVATIVCAGQRAAMPRRQTRDTPLDGEVVEVVVADDALERLVVVSEVVFEADEGGVGVAALAGVMLRPGVDGHGDHR